MTVVRHGTLHDHVGESDADGAPSKTHGFGMMFPKLRQFRKQDEEGLIELGHAMEKGPELGFQPHLAAGFTYFAQFVTHDVSRDLTRGLSEAPLDAVAIKQGRSPALDLDSLYGEGPQPRKVDKLTNGVARYQDDMTHLTLGFNQPKGEGWNYDLPRAVNDPSNRSRALIPDERNDENLVVAQTHVAFIKFHNAMVDHLAGEGAVSEGLFEKARDEVVKHYQCIILNDFLPKVLDNDVLNQVIERKDKPRYFEVKRGEAWMPVEFAFAAFRFAHSMVRESYEWSAFHETGATAGPARLDQLFRNTGSLGKMQDGLTVTLQREWVIDWTRFHDFTGTREVTSNPRYNRARLIGPSVNKALGNLHFPEQIPENLRSLAVLDLLRGWTLGLPAGQAIASELQEWLDARFLSDEEIARGEHETLLRKFGFDANTPLWYYVLKEAFERNGGTKLGPVGSFIVAETLIGLARVSRPSIFDDKDWKPVRSSVGKFGMADLLAFASAINPGS